MLTDQRCCCKIQNVHTGLEVIIIIIIIIYYVSS